MPDSLTEFWKYDLQYKVGEHTKIQEINSP